VTVAVSLIATLITFVFAGLVLRQYLQRPRSYRLVWTAALVCYGAATGVQFIAEIFGWSTASFRLWYLFGGLLTAAYLGQGTAFLLLPRRVASVLLFILCAASLWGAYRTFTVPLGYAEIRPPAGKISPNATLLTADLRALAALMNVYGTLLLVGGAVWSVCVYMDRMLDRRRRAAYRLVSNILIAAGSLIVASAGSLETFGHGEYLYAGEIFGISIIFLGFLRSRESMKFPIRWTKSPANEAGDTRTSPIATDPDLKSFQSLKRLSDRTGATRR
jgi:hypothetical protein